MKKTKIIFCLALVLNGGLFGCSTTVEQPRRYIVRFDNPSERTGVLPYSKPSPETLKQIKVARVSLNKDELNRLAALPKDMTHGVRWLIEEKPDPMREGPWNTQIYIFTSTDTNHCVRVELVNHASGGVEHRWLNGKMLFVTVWFGRIAWTDFILDTETQRFAYIEDGRLNTVLDGSEK